MKRKIAFIKGWLVRCVNATMKLVLYSFSEAQNADRFRFRAREQDVSCEYQA